jgi:beta-glucosidase
MKHVPIADRRERWPTVSGSSGQQDDSALYFLWASGVEDTFVPQVRAGYRALDEYALMGHYEHWRQDLALATQLGVRALRWGIPWYRVEPAPGEYDWRWTDQVIPHIVENLGLQIILDLVHYGCPDWLQGGFASPHYPDAVAAYAAAVIRRYRRWVHWYTPLNEPLVTAQMCGRRGVWPPYLRGERGYARLTVNLADGILRTVEAVRQEEPRAVAVHVEATGVVRAHHPAIATVRFQEEAWTLLGLDLLTGKVDEDHPLAGRLLSNEISWHRLEDLRRRGIALDVLGLNFYPQWSTTELYLNRNGRLRARPTALDGATFGEMIEAYAGRYGAPVMVTETSAVGGDEGRAAWLQASLATIKRLRADGVPVIGYTWFPMFTMIDWRYRFGTKPADQYHVELGAFRLTGDAERWRATPLASAFARATADTDGSVGRLEPSSTPRPSAAAAL